MSPSHRTRDRADHIVEAWRRERPDLDPSSVEIVTRVWHLAKLLEDDRRRLLARVGIDSAQLDLLGTLRRSGAPYALSTRAIADRAGVSPAAISQRVSRAEQRGWLTRTPGDGRSVTVQLTSSGRDVIDGVAGRIFEHEAGLLEALSQRERTDLRRLLKKLIAATDGWHAGHA